MFSYVKAHPFRMLLLVMAIAAAAVAGFLAWVSHELLYDPVCGNWHPGMTKEEKIEMALEIANREPRLVFEITNPETKLTYLGRGKQIPYPDVASILRENHECCKVVSKQTVDTEHPREDLPEGDEGVLILRYKGSYEGSDHQAHQAPIDLRQDLNNCKH